METVVHKATIAILDTGRSFDGGIFRSMREARLLQVLVSNGSAATLGAFQTGLSERVLAGGSIAMLAVASVSAALVAAFAVCSCACAWRTVRLERQRIQTGSSNVSVWRRQTSIQRVRSVSGWLAILCLVLLAVTLMPMILASAANFRMHSSLSSAPPSPEDGARESTVADRVSRLLGMTDAFLGGLTNQIRSEAVPVMREAQVLTGRLKARAQATYEAAFMQSTGAAQLLEASDELLRRMSDFYYVGRNMSASLELLQAALSDLKNVEFFTYDDKCRSYHSPDSNELCANHSRAAISLKLVIQSVRDDWTRANSSTDKEEAKAPRSSLLAHAKNLTKLVHQLVGALDGTENTPQRQQEIRRAKLGVGDEINRNMSDVFDRELNSTAFLLESVESQLRLLQTQLDSARASLARFRLQFPSAYAESMAGPEDARFGITLGLLILFLACMVALAAGVAPTLLKSLNTSSRMRYLVGFLYLITFLVIAVAILLNTGMYIVTAVLRAEACRYLLDTRSPANQSKADEFLVPEVNDALAELQRGAVLDANASQIPIKAVGSILGALQHSCSNNLPLLVALGADRYIDEAALDKTAETVAFQTKGLGILKREMLRMNLEQLRDEKLPEDLQNLKPFFRSYTTTKFSGLSRRLRPRAVSAAEIESQLEAFIRLNDRVDRLLPDSESSVKQLSGMNAKSATRSLHAVDYLRLYAVEIGAYMIRLEAEKDVNSVVEQVIANVRALDTYLLNRTLWVETASRMYIEHIMSGTLNESLWIGKRVGTRFLSSIVRCRALHDMYVEAVSVPCGAVLTPLCIMCFCIGWLLCCAFVLVLVSMFGFCRSRLWITGIAALEPVESALLSEAALELRESGSVSNGHRRTVSANGRRASRSLRTGSEIGSKVSVNNARL